MYPPHAPVPEAPYRGGPDVPFPPWRHGTALVSPVHHVVSFPDRCVVCNAHAPGARQRKTLWWHPGWVYFLIAAGLLIYAIGAVLLRKRADIEFSLCKEHRRRRTLGLVAAIGGPIVSIIALIVSAANESGIGAIFSGLLFFATLIGGVFASRVFKIVRIDQRVALISAGPEFMASLPGCPPSWHDAAMGVASPPGGFYAPASPGWGGAGAMGTGRGMVPVGGWGAPVPCGGWSRPGAAMPDAGEQARPAATAGHANPLAGGGWNVDLPPAPMWRVPADCAGCGDKAITLGQLRAGGAAQTAPWLAPGLCMKCSARQSTAWKPAFFTGLAACAGAVVTAILLGFVPPLPPVALFALPIAAAAGTALLMRMVLRGGGAGAPIAFVGKTPPTAARTRLWCAHEPFARQLAHDNGGSLAPARRPAAALVGPLVVAATAALASGAILFYAQWPSIIVDNATGDAVQIWVDGEPIAVVEPNADGDDVTRIRVPRGDHSLGYSDVDASEPDDSLSVQIKSNGRHLYNPGRLACHWRELTPYGIDPYTAHLNSRIPWKMHGPLDRQEFMTLEDIDHWFEDTPEEVDMHGKPYRTAIVRGEICTELAQAGCSPIVLDELIACERAAIDVDQVDRCRIEAFDACSGATEAL